MLEMATKNSESTLFETDFLGTNKDPPVLVKDLAVPPGTQA